MSTQQFAEVLAGIWERSKGTVNSQLTSLEQAATALADGTLDDTTRQQAERDAHKLAGSVGTFGFTEGTRLAREIEHLLQASPVADQTHAERLAQLVAALRQELNPTPAPQPTSNVPATSMYPLLLAVGEDATFLEQIALTAAAWGMHVQTAPDIETARQALLYTHPAVVLLTVADTASLGEIETFLSDLTQRQPALPVILLGQAMHVLDHLTMATAGVQAFLQQPVTPAHVLDVVLQVAQHTKHSTARVLLVTDDRQVITALQHALVAHPEIRLTLLHEAEHFWLVFTDTVPDLVILDTTTPSLPGLAWCQKIRSMPPWATLPVVGLTASTEVDAVQQVLRAGADDCVSKPITGPDLVVRLLHRLARSRQFSALLETDPLLGIPTRHKAIPVLSQLLHLAMRHAQPFTLVNITLDHFTRLNNRYGRASGNAVLRFFNFTLAQAFRKSDVVARWDEDTFVVGLYGMRREDGLRRLTTILNAIRQHTFVGRNDTPFQVTFSAGLATCPQDGTDFESLHSAAASALSQAKLHGGERILPAGWTADAPRDR
jgi:diguanylate cyclase (GGDEF)-like protein